MTEEEAKTKWCPFARGISENGGNRIAYGSAGDGPVEDDYTSETAMKYPCIGSACMAFRQHGWRDKEDGQLKSMAYERAEPQYWEPMFHCGLAGKP